MPLRPYCPVCGCAASDEECPHWDYEYDPRVPAEPPRPLPLPMSDDDERWVEAQCFPPFEP